MSEPDEMDEDGRWFADDDPRDPYEDDGDDAFEECGRWMNGSLMSSCMKAGSEECDFECPLRRSL